MDSTVILLLLVLGVGLVRQVQGRQYDPRDCPHTCVCKHPDMMPVGYRKDVQINVTNGVYIRSCTLDPYNDLVRILQTYPTIDGLDISNSLINAAGEAAYMTKLIARIGTLTNVKLLAISFENLTVLPDNIEHLSSLKFLFVTHSQLTELPGSIGNLSSLETLYVSKNKLAQLPDSIGNLASLQILAINNNNLTVLPDTICNMTSLVSLYVYGNSLKEMPERIGYLSALQILSAYDNNLTSLPDSLGDLTLLELLFASNNSLAKLPDSTGNLSSLQILYASNNRLTELPDNIGDLSALLELSVGGNPLTVLPDSIGNLTSLVELYVYKNNLKELPGSIGYLSSLHILSVYDNSLTQLPDSTCKLSKLVELYVDYNSLIELPDSTGNLSSLQILYVDNNRLTELPDSIGDLSALLELSVGGNPLRVLPDSIGNLTSLMELYIYENSLMKLPESISYLLALRALNVSNNHLKTLPTTIVQLPLLMNITANHNNITSFDLGSIMSVPHRLVDLSNNQILTLSTIPTNEPNWKTLDLSNNKLTSLDSWYFRLSVSSTPLSGSYVRLLNVSNNAISSITNHNGSSTMPLPTGNVKWKVDLSHSDIHYLHDISYGLNITYEELVYHLKSEQLILENNPLRCDCIDYTIYKELKVVKHTPSLSCGAPERLSGYDIAEIALDMFTCPITTDCPDGCICTDMPSQELVIVDCHSYTGKSLPQRMPTTWRNASQFKYTLDFEGGSLVNLGNWDYLQWVVNASFGHNQIAEIPAGFFDHTKRFNVLKLNNNKIRTLPLIIDNWPDKIYLGQNDWICSCVNKPTIQQIEDNKEKVVDYLNVTCSGPENLEGKIFNHVKYVFCSGDKELNVTSDIKVALIAVCTVVVFVLLAIGIVYARRVWIYKMFKWHPFNRDGAEEAMKEFDVFLSYCEDDSVYIENDILPKLEQFGFKVCHHREHFLAGASIIGNIHNAIMNSKRTLVFFSMEYLASGLCMHEFHTALTMQVRERCNRLVTIKDTMVDIKTLETGMRSFFEHYTYIEQESPKFWDNLLYVLPEKRMNAPGRRNAVQNGNEFEMAVHIGDE